eukprot:CAMPEP_0116873964 /NCGR_PEP_ID=MMETSP0463-20121206/5323_1 /TAXON_ID=181622 /ORGANISM="Strombidinopsis sp, Strain SopsisLIS2011" /LENGTH=41 /DNA_ID= /DNA_START= /DNA_END= /DNA_ORIENTATION=
MEAESDVTSSSDDLAEEDDRNSRTPVRNGESQLDSSITCLS